MNLSLLPAVTTAGEAEGHHPRHPLLHSLPMQGYRLISPNC